MKKKSFLPKIEFDKKFPYTQKADRSGGYGKVFFSGDYVVKTFSNPSKSTFYMDAARELAFYQLVNHPNVAKVVNWTLEKEKDSYQLRFALYRGETIFDRIRFVNDQKSFHEIYNLMHQVLAAINFLNINGIVHGDIKEQNVIYYDGKYQLIDFGISQFAFLREDGKYYLFPSWKYYTSNYRDPELVIDKYIPALTDEYAFGMTLYYLLTYLHLKRPASYDYYANEYTIYPYFEESEDDLETERIDELVNEGNSLSQARNLALTDEKLNIKYHIKALTSYPISKRGEIYSKNFEKTEEISSISEIQPSVPDPNCLFDINSEIFAILVNISKDFKASMRTIFLTLHLYHRVSWRVSKKKEDRGFLLISCYLLVSPLFDKINPTPEHIISDKKEQNRVYDIVADILVEIDGKIYSKTLFDYFSSAEELIEVLPDAISCNYSISKIPKVSKNLQKTSKNIDIVEFSKLFKFPSSEKSFEYTPRRELDLAPVYENIEREDEAFAWLVINKLSILNTIPALDLGINQISELIVYKRLIKKLPKAFQANLKTNLKRLSYYPVLEKILEL